MIFYFKFFPKRNGLKDIKVIYSNMKLKMEVQDDLR